MINSVDQVENEENLMGFHEFYQMLDLRNYETRNAHKSAPKLLDNMSKI